MLSLAKTHKMKTIKSFKKTKMYATERGYLQALEDFLVVVDDLYGKNKLEVWGKFADEICDLIENQLKKKITGR